MKNYKHANQTWDCPTRVPCFVMPCGWNFNLLQSKITENHSSEMVKSCPVNHTNQKSTVAQKHIMGTKKTKHWKTTEINRIKYITALNDIKAAVYSHIRKKYYHHHYYYYKCNIYTFRTDKQISIAALWVFDPAVWLWSHRFLWAASTVWAQVDQTCWPINHK